MFYKEKAVSFFGRTVALNEMTGWFKLHEKDGYTR